MELFIAIINNFAKSSISGVAGVLLPASGYSADLPTLTGQETVNLEIILIVFL